MGFILLAYLPALIGMFIIAMFVLARQRRPMHVTFAGTLFIIILWQALQLISLFADNGYSLWLMRFSLLVSNFACPMFILFALLYPGARSWVPLKTILAIFLPAVILAPLSLVPEMVSSIERVGYDLFLHTGYLYDIQTVVGTAYIMVALGILAGKYYKETGQDRVGILVVFLAFLFPLVVGLLANYLWIGAAGTQYQLPVTFLVTGFLITYAMIKHKLFDIRLAAVRGAAYILALLTLGAIYYLLAFIISELFFSQSETDTVSSPISIALALILAFIFQPVKRFFDHLTNRIFFHDDYNTNDFLARLGEELSTASELRNMLRRASKEISDTIQAEYGVFFVRYGDGQHVSVGTPGHSQISLSEIEKFDAYIDKHNSSAIVVDLLPETERIYKLLQRHNIALVLPLMHSGRALSYLFIGHRRSREYTTRDVRTLETIADELVIAIQNALSVQEVRELNATLQQRINDATKELRASNAQLQRLDEAKDEFVSMASHQLRTPLTSVKGYISMVLEGDVGKITATQRQLLSEAFTSSERMVHLINDFLNVSRLQTGKFMLERRKVDLSKIIAQEVESLQTTAHSHDMKLQYRAPSYFPMLYVDEGKLRQVLMNFIDNAIYYSHEHTTIKVELTTGDGEVVLKVHDTGIGVPKAEQAHLFTKFFRATNARKQRPDGTGVGLFLAKKVIDAHGGSIMFESVEGEGSMFGFRLPIKKLSAAPAEDAD